MMTFNKRDTPFLNYLAKKQLQPGDKLPKLTDISRELGISVGKLREQLEMARSQGLVSVRPRVGIQREPFDFSAVILNPVLFSNATGEATFAQFSQLRRGIEVSLWLDAVQLLTDNDKAELKQFIEHAWQKLGGKPIHIPNAEHRQLHLKIFSRLDNHVIYPPRLPQLNRQPSGRSVAYRLNVLTKSILWPFLAFRLQNIVHLPITI